LFDPVAKVGECFRLRRKWRGEFIIHKLSSHSAFLYNPKTNKYVEKSVHINKIKPCYQRDNIPDDDEVIEDIPIVEVTYPLTFPRTITTHTTNQQNQEQKDPVQRTETSTETKNPPTAPITDTPGPTTDTPTSDQDSTEAQQGSTRTEDQLQDKPFWNALQIVLQSTGKGKPRYLIRWEDETAPDSWSDAVNVSDELKRVYYLTHTKTGAKRVHPL